MITKATVTTSAAQIRPSTYRRALYIRNISDTDCFFSFDGSTTTTLTGDSGSKPGVKVASGATHVFTFSDRPDISINNEIWAIHEGTGSKSVVIHEW